MFEVNWHRPRDRLHSGTRLQSRRVVASVVASDQHWEALVLLPRNSVCTTRRYRVMYMSTGSTWPDKGPPQLDIGANIELVGTRSQCFNAQCSFAPQSLHVHPPPSNPQNPQPKQHLNQTHSGRLVIARGPFFYPLTSDSCTDAGRIRSLHAHSSTAVILCLLSTDLATGRL